MNRKYIGILSAIIIVTEALVVGALTMLRTRIILDNFGSNVNGVIQLATNLSTYMLLFESGLTAAYQFKMYKPLINNDYKHISALYAGMNKNFVGITAKMSFCSFFIAFLYSIILKKQSIGYWEAVSLLAVMGLRLIAPYVFTISLRTLLIVKERKFITDIVETLKNVISILVEIYLINSTKLPLFVILSFHIFLTICSRYIYIVLVNTYYANKIIHNVECDMSPKAMTGDILVHKVAGMITSNTDNVLLSLFPNLGLNSVTIYTSYNTVITYPVTLVIRLVDSMRATLALKINGDIKNAYSYYREVFSFSKLCCLIITPVFISQINDFINLWIGRQYTIGKINIVLFSLIAMHQMLIPTIYAARDAKGLYKESKTYSIVQAIVNMGLSILLIQPLGITGVLIGTVVCDWLVLEPFNIALIYREIFNMHFDMYYDYLGQFAVIGIMSIINIKMNNYLINVNTGWVGFVTRSMIVSVIVVIVSFIYLFATDNYFRKLVDRFLHFHRN